MPLAVAGAAAESVLVQYGAMGAVTAVLIVFARTAYKDLRDRADRLEARNTALSDSLREQVVPALTLAAEAVRESAALMNELRREREQLIAEIRRERGR